MPDYSSPAPQDLQFQRAEPLPADSGAGPQCVICKKSTGDSHYQARGHNICTTCAQKIQAGQQAPTAGTLARAALYGGGAALAGCALYATVAIVTGLEIGLVAIVVGYLVGKAIRAGSNGLGGRPQQILAVALTYFAITTSYIPVILYQSAKHPAAVQQAASNPSGSTVESTDSSKPPMSAGSAVLFLLLIAAAAPFLSLTSGVSGIITLFIIFIGLQRAWRLTGRAKIVLTGPFQTASAQ